MAKHNIVGKKGEEIAETFLKDKGYSILHVNWRSHPYEIDLVARDRNELVIVEVKTRSSLNYGLPEESVHETKRKNLLLATEAYIEENEIDLSCRFDIIAVLIQSNRINIKHLQDAFSAFD